MKIRALMYTHDVEIALENDSKWDDDQKKKKVKILKGAKDLFSLSLTDNVPREVSSCKNSH